MKRFEYMSTTTIREKLEEKYGKYQTANIDEFLNKLGAEGWDVSINPNSGGFFAKREITDEPAPLRKE